MTPFKQAQRGFIAIRVAHAKDHRITRRASNSACNAALLDTEVDPAHAARLMKSMDREVREIEQVKRDGIFMRQGVSVVAADRGGAA